MSLAWVGLRMIIPGGFGNAGIEGKKLDFVGMFAIMNWALLWNAMWLQWNLHANGVMFTGAHTTRRLIAAEYPIIASRQAVCEHAYGGTMRLTHAAQVKTESKVAQLYQSAAQIATARLLTASGTRYEVNPYYVNLLEQKGLSFSGYHEQHDELMQFFKKLPEEPSFFIATPDTMQNWTCS